MIAALIAIGVFSALGYSTPPERTLLVPGIDLNRAPRPAPFLPPKYPAANIDYMLDWSRLLLGDTIKEGLIETIEGDVVPTRMVFNDTTSSFFLGAGTPETMHRVRCQITTVIGRTFDFILNLNTCAL